ncbi:MAG TPA: hypothetical protein PKY82_10815 [Pyrinomonadaceae bacterium]|nr:hypothetical protein [Pyrinomonadaceae bacterium]
MGFPDTAPGQKMSTFYNLVHAVGDRAPNLINDVKLVQYFLKSLFVKIPNHESVQELQIDGICNAVTMRWILKFQIEASNSHPGKILIDQRIDRIREKNFIGSISHTTYALYVLNASVLKYNPEAFAATPLVIPLENIGNVAPPSLDIVQQQRKHSTLDSVKQIAIRIASSQNDNLGEIKKLAIDIVNYN